MVETLGNAMDDRIFQPVVMQHGRIDKGGKLRLTANNIFRLRAHAIPDRVERRELSAALRIDLMFCHAALANSSTALL